MKKKKEKEISIEKFHQAVEKLPDHEFKYGWLRWLREYHTPGPFGREAGEKRNAKFVYNNLAYPEMLLWLIQAAGIDDDLVKLAQSESAKIPNVRSQSATIRKYVPWEEIEQALWE